MNSHKGQYPSSAGEISSTLESNRKRIRFALVRRYFVRTTEFSRCLFAVRLDNLQEVIVAQSS